jgi:hypothetical protein
LSGGVEAVQWKSFQNLMKERIAIQKAVLIQDPLLQSKGQNVQKPYLHNQNMKEVSDPGQWDCL